MDSRPPTPRYIWLALQDEDWETARSELEQYIAFLRSLEQNKANAVPIQEDDCRTCLQILLHGSYGQALDGHVCVMVRLLARIAPGKLHDALSRIEPQALNQCLFDAASLGRPYRVTTLLLLGTSPDVISLGVSARHPGFGILPPVFPRCLHKFAEAQTGFMDAGTDEHRTELKISAKNYSDVCRSLLYFGVHTESGQTDIIQLPDHRFELSLTRISFCLESGASPLRCLKLIRESDLIGSIELYSPNDAHTNTYKGLLKQAMKTLIGNLLAFSKCSCPGYLKAPLRTELISTCKYLLEMSALEDYAFILTDHKADIDHILASLDQYIPLPLEAQILAECFNSCFGDARELKELKRTGILNHVTQDTIIAVACSLDDPPPLSQIMAWISDPGFISMDEFTQMVLRQCFGIRNASLLFKPSK